MSNLHTAPGAATRFGSETPAPLELGMASAVRCRTGRSCATRDARAFEALMRRHNRRLFRAARSILRDADAAEDAVQETYIRAFTHLSSYAPTGSFAAWLTRIAINEALMLRRRLKRPTLSLDEIDVGRGIRCSVLAPDARVCYVRQLGTSEHSPASRTGARPPAADFRIVFVLREVEQLSIAETADCLGLNAATVKTRLHRARARLRAVLTRRLRREQLHLFDFGGERCDRIVAAVHARLSAGAASRSISAGELAYGSHSPRC